MKHSLSTAAATYDADAPGDARGRYGTIVIVGGGCYGAYYVRQLARAARAGALVWRRLLVVDRLADCRVAQEQSPAAWVRAAVPPPEIVVAEWREFFIEYLGEASKRSHGESGDAIVPSPLMPHLLYEWLFARARARWPNRRVESRPIDRPPNVPWQRAGSGTTHYVSFAEWMCPINCIEPALCPEIRGPRSWSLPPAIRAYVEAEQSRGRPLRGPILLHCTHRAYGVGMIDTAAVLSGDALVEQAASAGPAELLVATVSHCHGALDVLSIE